MPLDDEIAEREEPVEVLHRKAEQVADILRESHHAIAFTGAGISTSSGIPDFRGPTGVWTLRGKGLPAARPKVTSAITPSPTHMAMVGLYEAGKLKFVISQNTDGLHVRSGLPSEALAELHGNNNIERCMECSRSVWRPYNTRAIGGAHQHVTGRRCALCGGPMMDTIVNFSESLPADQLNAAEANSCAADVCMILGSSCRVTPAADLPGLTKQRGGHLIIVNLQRTPLDGLADVRVWSKTDTFMRLLMGRLGLPIPPMRDKLAETLRESRSQKKATGKPAPKQ